MIINNMIFILVDQFRNESLSKYSIFEKLKTQSIFCSNMYTALPYTIGSLHALFSGQYGFQNGVDGYFNSKKYKKSVTLPELLSKNNFYTICTTPSALCVPSQGIDELIVYKEEKVDYFSLHKSLLDRLITEKDKKFLFLHYNFIHTKMQKEYLKNVDETDQSYFNQKVKNREYYERQTEKAAEYIENIVSYMQQNNVFDDSIVVIMTDHGCSIGERLGEKSYGVYTYDYTSKIWAYIFSKEELKGIDISKTTRSIDIFPTILDLMDFDIPSHLSGQSLLCNSIDNREAFIETGGVGGFFPSPRASNIYTVVYNNKKIIYNLSNNKYEFYDLSKDPQELNNIYNENDLTCKELIMRLERYKYYIKSIK